jgi:uncharacterized protein (DUF302 family)
MLTSLNILRVFFGILISGAALGGAAAADNGLVSKATSMSVRETVEKIEAAAKTRGLTVFAKIDHAAEAQKAGLQMPPTVLLLVGNPKAGTPMMVEKPGIAIDLPLKVLVAQDAAGKTQITFNDAAFLKARHGVSDDAAKPLGGVAALVEAVLK